MNWRLCFLLILLSGCKGRPVKSGKVIIVQPLGDFSREKSERVCHALRELNSRTLLRSNIPLPAMAWYPARGRYRADSLIRWLSGFGNADTILIGLTNKDISTTNGKISDWGVMGLGNCPGIAGVASTYRLSPKDLDSQLYKVSVHELAHVLGLPHCSDTTCIMRDEKGGNTLNNENGFCAVCKQYLRAWGWRLRGESNSCD